MKEFRGFIGFCGDEDPHEPHTLIDPPTHTIGMMVPICLGLTDHAGMVYQRHPIGGGYAIAPLSGESTILVRYATEDEIPSLINTAEDQMLTRAVSRRLKRKEKG
jgi:hypothetical protein